VFDRLRALNEAALTRLQPLIESRAARGIPRDTHGDLHLDHVYYFPDRSPPDDLVAIDCIEFAERFRHADPVADAAFLAMDLAFQGRRDLADAFTARYLRASDDAEGAALFPFYTAYRAAVRAKVEGMELTEKEIPEAERTAARTRARAHWLLALGTLEEPDRRPCLVLVAGLPGTGKSTLARGIAERAGFTVIRSDVVRKELVGKWPDALGEGIYTAEWTERTYAECLRRAEAILADGGRVIVDANFPDEDRRRDFLEAAGRLAVQAVFLWCRASPEIAKRRVSERRGDVSDATVEVYDQAAARWQEFGPLTRRTAREVNADGTPDETLTQGTAALREARVVG
jgi:predicted kinase